MYEGRLRPAHTLNRLRTAMTKVSQQRRDELAIQLLAVTRADRTDGRVACGGGCAEAGGAARLGPDANFAAAYRKQQ